MLWTATCTRPQAKSQKSLDPWVSSTHDPQQGLSSKLATPSQQHDYMDFSVLSESLATSSRSLRLVTYFYFETAAHSLFAVMAIGALEEIGRREFVALVGGATAA